MKFEEMLDQPTKKMRLALPEPLDQLIKDYQTNEKNRHDRKSSKEHLVIRMMMIGKHEFEKESFQMKKEFEEYQS